MRNHLNFALIGHHVGYSQSPQVFEAIFKQLGVDGHFDIHAVLPDQLESKLQQLVLDGVRGFSVTIPYKREVIQYLDDIGPIAQVLDAVNSIHVEDGRLYGYNTDCYGFSLPLRPYAPQLKHRRALVFGCGGAACAAIYALFVDLEVREFFVVGRSAARLEQFRKQLNDRLEHIEITTVQTGSRVKSLTGDCHIIVNCTPLGGWNHTEASPFPPDFKWGSARIYYDLNYNTNNKLVAAARKAGLTTIDGSAMLVGQGIRSFQIWTGQSVPFDPVFDTVFTRAE